MFSNQIACLFPGTHKLFHEPLFDTLTPLLSTASVFPQMVAFSFHYSIFDIVSTLSLETSFVVSDIMKYLPVLHSFHFLSSWSWVYLEYLLIVPNPWNYQILLVSDFLIPPSRLLFVTVVHQNFFLIFLWQFDKLQQSVQDFQWFLGFLPKDTNIAVKACILL